ncbi:MAG: DUF6323 family protein [Syntrophomonadaceae bacterium]|nr:DUF6323 family protein [Syntrophomonadaceae bacterium]
MALLDIYSLTDLNPYLSVDELLEINKFSAPWGLLLSPRDAKLIIEGRNLSLQNYHRVELSTGVLKHIITEFCSSPYLNQPDYAETLNELVDIFYFMKNETEDRIGDSDLIDLMKYYFNNSCQGSTDLLRNRELALIVRILKKSWELTRGDDNGPK